MSRQTLLALSSLLAVATLTFSARSQEPILLEESDVAAWDENSGTVWEPEVWAPSMSTFYFGIDALWLHRNRPDNQTLAVRSSQTDGTVLQTLDTDSVYFQFEPGLRLTVGAPINEDHSIEMVYFGLNNWFKQRTVTIATDTNLEEQTQSPFLAYVIVNGSQQYEYNSMFNNVELNLRREVPAGQYRTFTWLMGARYLNLQESFSILNEQTQLVDNLGQPTGQIGDERGRAQTYNNLIGFQLGAELTEAFGPMILGVHGSAGAYANISKSRYAHRNLIDGAFDSFGSAGARSSYNTDLSGVFTLGFDSVFRIYQGISLRFAYEMLIATGMSFAPDQALPVTAQFDAGVNQFVTTFAPGADFDQDGLLFLHGPSVGMLFVW